MIERYKVLGAMFAFDEFTATDLAKYSKVKLGTVRTVIDREKKYYLELVRKDSTGRRGGQFNRYRIKPDKLENLRSKIYDLFEQVRGSFNAQSESKTVPKTPLSLLAAEDILHDLIKEEKNTTESRKLLELAELNLKNAQTEIDAHLNVSEYPQAYVQIRENLRLVGRLLETTKEKLNKSSNEERYQPPDTAVTCSFEDEPFIIELESRRYLRNFFEYFVYRIKRQDTVQLIHRKISC